MRRFPSTRSVIGTCVVFLACVPLAWPVQNANSIVLEAVGTDQTGAGVSRNYSGVTGAVAVGSASSRGSRNEAGVRVLVGPAALGAQALGLPTLRERIADAVLGRTDPSPDLDRNGDGVVDVADLLIESD